MRNVIYNENIPFSETSISFFHPISIIFLIFKRRTR